MENNNEEIMTEMENEVNEVSESNYDNTDSTEGGSTAGGIVIGLGIAAVGGLVAFAISRRNEILQRRIKNLEKKGYKVEKLPEPEEEVDEDDAVVDMKKAK
jgi:hypothetical protein